MKILVTGSSGLIGGEVVEFFCKQGHDVVGVDNNMRKQFFGDAGDTAWNLHRLAHLYPNFTPLDTDIREHHYLKYYVFDEHGPFDAIIHCAAQPSHDKARDIPLIDFQVNALGTMHLLDLTRECSPNAVFVFTSTNKVYGDNPNRAGFVELETRYEYDSPTWENGVGEWLSIDHCTHSVFGASKVAADIMTQEYGRYYGLKTCVLRGGCLTGPTHSSAELHGFLSYLVKCAANEIEYKIFGYKGKQVRDNIHSYDVARAIEEIIKNPRPGSVYNLGGGRANSISILEAIAKAEEFTGKKMKTQYVDTPRVGDHICYITDLSSFQRDYPDWKITKSLDNIFEELVGGCGIGKVTERYIPGDGCTDYFESYASAIAPLCKGKVLDIGCGHGYLTSRIADNPAVESVLGTDASDCRKIKHNKVDYRTISTSDLCDEPYGAFDAICSTEHIEHLPAEVQSKLVKWISKSLAPDGIFLGSMPDPDDISNPNPYHAKTYKIEEWERDLKWVFQNVKVWRTSACGYCWKATDKLGLAKA